MNLRVLDAKTVGVSVDETTKLEDIDTLFKVGSGRRDLQKNRNMRSGVQGGHGREGMVGDGHSV